MRKKISALLLSVALCITVMPATGFASEFTDQNETADEMALQTQAGDEEIPFAGDAEESQETEITATPTEKPEITKAPMPTAGPEITKAPMPTAGPEITTTPMPTFGPEVTTIPEPTTGPEATATPMPTVPSTPKPISVKWKAAKWLNSTAAQLTMNTNTDGVCYYKWIYDTEPRPVLDDSSFSVLTRANNSFKISLKGLKENKSVIVYLQIAGADGRRSKIWHLTLDQKNRPTPTPTPAQNRPTPTPAQNRPTPTPAHTPVVPKVSDSVVKGLDSPLKFTPGKFYNFSVIGAGTTNSKPGEGDVRWVPKYWSTSANPSGSQKNTSWKIGSARGIATAGTYNLYVFFQKQVYKKTAWKATNTISSVNYQFRSAALSQAELKQPVLNGTYNGTTGIVVKWKNVSGVSGYKIYRKDGSSTKWTNIATVKGSSTSSYADRSVKHGTTYTYTVRAYKSSLLSSYDKTGTKIVRLAAPVPYNPYSKASGQLTSKWKKISAVSGYQVQYATSKSFSGVKTVSTTATAKTVSGLKKGSTYYVRIRAYKKISGKTYYSAWSSTKSIKTRK